MKDATLVIACNFCHEPGHFIDELPNEPQAETTPI
jgi:hypothetical protein